MNNIEIVLRRFNGTDWDTLCIDPSTIMIKDSNNNSYPINDEANGFIKANGDSTPEVLKDTIDFNDVKTGIFYINIKQGDTVLNGPNNYNIRNRNAILISCKGLYSNSTYYGYQVLQDEYMGVLYRCQNAPSSSWSSWKNIGTSDELFIGSFFSTSPFDNLNQSSSSILKTNNKIDFYFDFSANSTANKTGYVNNVFKPKIMCCFPILSRTSPYLPIGSVWIYPDGRFLMYGSNNGGYIYGSYET